MFLNFVAFTFLNVQWNLGSVLMFNVYQPCRLYIHAGMSAFLFAAARIAARYCLYRRPKSTANGRWRERKNSRVNIPVVSRA